MDEPAPKRVSYFAITGPYERLHEAAEKFANVYEVTGRFYATDVSDDMIHALERMDIHVRLSRVKLARTEK